MGIWGELRSAGNCSPATDSVLLEPPRLVIVRWRPRPFRPGRGLQKGEQPIWRFANSDTHTDQHMRSGHIQGQHITLGRRGESGIPTFHILGMHDPASKHPLVRSLSWEAGWT